MEQSQASQLFGREGNYADAHAHLLDYPQGVLEGVLKRAYAGGVRYIVNNATTSQQSQAIHSLSQQYSGEGYPRIVKSFGVHPMYLQSIEQRESWFEDVENQLIKSESHLVGEIGLDYRKDVLEKNPKQLQQKVFERQFQLAVKYCRPVSLHNVRAHGEMLKFLKKVAKQPDKSPPLIMHSYGGSKQITQALLKLESLPIYFSLSLKHNQQLCKVIPLEKLLLESDAPYQLDRQIVQSCGEFPAEKFEVQNEPRFLRAHAKFAKYYELPVEAFFKQIWLNSLKAFRLLK